MISIIYLKHIKIIDISYNYKKKKGSGRISRYHNWDLSNSSHKHSFSRKIEDIPRDRVCEKLLVTPDELKYQEIKFVAMDYIDLVRTVEGLTKSKNKMLKNILTEMPPNFKILGFEVCEKFHKVLELVNFLYKQLIIYYKYLLL